jgi:pilus assembly protein CpaF
MSFIQRKINDQSKPADPFAEQAATSPSAPHAEQYHETVGGLPTKHRTPPKIAHLRKLLRSRVLKTVDEADQWSRAEPDKEAMITERLKAIVDKLAQEKAEFRLNQQEFAELREAILNDVLGFGAIEPLVQNRTIAEIMVNGPEVIFIEQKGRMFECEIVFDDDDHAMWVAQRIVRRLGRELNRENPMADARLPDGSRVHVVSAPSALCGTTMSIRKFPDKRLTIDDLIKFGSLTKEVGEFLEACVVSAVSILVSGGTGSGKTTLLNVLSGFIPEEERIVTIEDAAELQLHQRHVVRLETAPPIPGGDGKKGQLLIRDLVRGSLRMRPDRIVVGECRGPEALDMLQAMNTGHDGSLTTVHSNTPRDSVARLETLVLMAGMDLPVGVVRRQIVSAIDLIVQLSRLKDGSRKITQITEIQGMEGEQVTLQDIFVYRLPGQSGNQPANIGGGKLESTGFRPKFIDRLEEQGFKLSGRIFGAGQARFDRSQ